MLVAHLDCAPGWRGGENQAFLLAKGLQENDVSQILIAFPGGALWKKAEAASLMVVPLRRFGEWDLLAAYKLRTLLKSLRPDILQVHTAHDLGPAALAARGLPVRLVAMRTVDFPLRDNPFSRWKYRRADRLVAVSRCVADGLIRQGIEPEKISTIYPCIDLEEVGRIQAASAGARRDLRESLGVSPDARVAGMFGALTVQKDPLTYVRAAAACLREFSGAHFIIAGEGSLRGAVEREIRALRADRQVRLLGFRPDALRIMAGVDCVVVSSINEGLNLTLLEAGALGIPVVATKAGGAPEAVRDGETGFLVPVGDAGAIAGRVAQLLKDPALRQRMGEKGKEFAKNFDVKHIVGRYRELYEGLF